MYKINASSAIERNKVLRNCTIKFHKIDKIKVLKCVFSVFISMILFLGIGIPIIKKCRYEKFLKDVNGICENNYENTSDIDNKKLLTLVNYNQRLPLNYEVELVEVNGIEVDECISESLKLMLDDACKAGLELKLLKGYITSSQQDILFNNKVNEYLETGEYTKVTAQAEAEKTVLPGGKSEFQTGLSVSLCVSDVNKIDFNKTKEYNWLKLHCIDYGFILRYPKTKENKTRMFYDPTIFRYVGKENAKKMRSLNMCLEEYAYYNSQRKYI